MGVDIYDIDQCKVGFTISFKYNGGSNPGAPRLITVLEMDDNNWVGYDRIDKKIKNYFKNRMTDYALIASDCRDILTNRMLNDWFESNTTHDKRRIYEYIMGENITYFSERNFGTSFSSTQAKDFTTFCKEIGYKPKEKRLEAEINKIKQKFQNELEEAISELRKTMGV